MLNIKIRNTTITPSVTKLILRAEKQEYKMLQTHAGYKLIKMSPKFSCLLEL